MKSLETTANVVCAYFSIDKADLRGSSRIEQYALPRHIFMFLARRERHSCSEIGRYLNRDHSTVIHGVQSIRDKIVVIDSIARHVANLQELLRTAPDSEFEAWCRGKLVRADSTAIATKGFVRL